ncbi:MAG: DUF4402 domain-containing protein [Bacteroidales bacterium]|nr:DUF4402 domain-containing protein [Bacteroidales bacterium]
MKTTVLKFFTLSVAIFAFSTISFGQQEGTASATSSVTIIKPITITKARDLVFGSIVSSSTNDVSVVATADENTEVSATGFGANEGDPLSVSSATRTSAQFNITGDANELFSIDLDETVSMTGDGGSLSVTLTKNLNDTDNTLGSGAAVLYVGGSFTIPAGQTAGTYTGTFDVTVTYQ